MMQFDKASMAVTHDVNWSRRLKVAGYLFIKNLNKESEAYNKRLYMERNDRLDNRIIHRYTVARPSLNHS